MVVAGAERPAKSESMPAFSLSTLRERIEGKRRRREAPVPFSSRVQFQVQACAWARRPPPSACPHFHAFER